MSLDDQESSDGPLVRSLAMSRNMALSVVDEVPHMIRLPTSDENPTLENDEESTTDRWKTSTSTTTSSSTSALPNSSDVPANNNVTDDVTESLQTKGTHAPVITSSSQDQDHKAYSNNSNTSVPSTITTNSQNSTTPVVKGTRRNDLLVGVVVSRWDNIVGPQAVYLWTEELTSVFYPANLPPDLSKLVKYVTDHTVDHQTATGRYIHPSVQRTTLCIVPDLNLAYLSLSIRVPSELDTILEFQISAPMTENSPDIPALIMPHSISVLYNLKYFNQFMLLRPLVVSWLVEFGPRIGVLLCKDNLQSSMINSWCAELCKTITTIQTCWAQDLTDFSETSTSSSRTGASNADFQSAKSASSNYSLESDTSYLLPTNAIMPKVAMGNILTSHLSTFGSSVIVGHDHLLINQIIRFLLCFSTAEEAYCSRYSLATLPDTFMKGLFVQGLILGGIGEKSISYKQVTTNRLPLTKIELGSKVKIRQTPVITHTQEKEVLVMQELNKLWTSTVLAAQVTEAFPTVVKDVAGFVSQFLKELDLLSPERRYGRLLLFRRTLHAKAMSLITFLHSIQHKPSKEKQKLTQLIPQILGLDNTEYLIVQVTAEKIRPGVMSRLLPVNVKSI